MQKIIATCGINCIECPAYIATQKNDDEERKRIAKLWTSAEVPLEPKDINCDGCKLVGGRRIKFCDVCDVRLCGLEKEVDNCAHCNDYDCEKLNKHLEFIQSTDAKENLEKIRESLELS